MLKPEQMQKLAADGLDPAAVRGLDREAALVDADGAVCGVVLSVDDFLGYREMVYEWAWAQRPGRREDAGNGDAGTVPLPGGVAGRPTGGSTAALLERIAEVTVGRESPPAPRAVDASDEQRRAA